MDFDDFNQEEGFMRAFTSESRVTIAPTWKQVGGVMGLICLGAFFYLKTTFTETFVTRKEFLEGKETVAETIKTSVQGLIRNQEYLMAQQAEMRTDIKGLIGRSGYQKNQ